MPAPIDAIVDAYNPQDTWEIAQIAKAADMDIAARVVCRMIQAPGRSAEGIPAPTQSVLTSDRAARQPIAAVERRRTRTAKQAAAAVPQPVTPPAKPALSPEQQAIWDLYPNGHGRPPAPPGAGSKKVVPNNPMQSTGSAAQPANPLAYQRTMDHLQHPCSPPSSPS